jgi:outer membrane protein assembly factor BamA
MRKLLPSLLVSLPILISVELFSVCPTALAQQTGSKDKSPECEVHKVRRIEIVGNHRTRHRVVMRSVTFLQGKPFSERDAEQTIKNLNKSGRFHKAVREDITVTFQVTDPELSDWRCFADLVIRVKEK